jgi:hypothetical protein
VSLLSLHEAIDILDFFSRVSRFRRLPVWSALARTFSTGTSETAKRAGTEAVMGESNGAGLAPAAINGTRPKLHGRAFYESIGSPKYIVAPMVDQSEFVSFGLAW